MVSMSDGLEKMWGWSWGWACQNVLLKWSRYFWGVFNTWIPFILTKILEKPNFWAINLQHHPEPSTSPPFLLLCFLLSWFCFIDIKDMFNGFSKMMCKVWMFSSFSVSKWSSLLRLSWTQFSWSAWTNSICQFKSTYSKSVIKY